MLHSLAAGTATVRATAADGTTATYSLPTHVALASSTAQYANNAEFGEPVDADPSDDFILRHPQFTSSYNPNRGSPNWVAYEIDATHFGAEDRCDCFTSDPALPATFPHLTTADYTGAGAFHGFGIDRGHLARSFDRTAGSLDNAFTFLFSNIIPQAAEQNQGPWAQLENHLGDFARFSNREVYVIAGVAGNAGTIKNEGRIVIPTHTWKVALILPRDQGLADIRDYRDVEYIAVLMPNVTGVRDVPWQTYLDYRGRDRGGERLRPARAAARRRRERDRIRNAAADRGDRGSGGLDRRGRHRVAERRGRRSIRTAAS